MKKITLMFTILMLSYLTAEATYLVDESVEFEDPAGSSICGQLKRFIQTLTQLMTTVATMTGYDLMPTAMFI